jgi:hypothetical protein
VHTEQPAGLLTKPLDVVSFFLKHGKAVLVTAVALYPTREWDYIWLSESSHESVLGAMSKQQSHVFELATKFVE